MHRKWTSGIAVLGVGRLLEPTAASAVPGIGIGIGIGSRRNRPASSVKARPPGSTPAGRGRAAAASGELVAAHRSLPLGTLVQVTALDTGRTVTVRISGRGPFRYSRIIDVSAPAAAQLGILHDGVSRVQLKTDRAPDQACPQGETRISAN